MRTMQELSAMLKIDKDDLDTELIRQPQLFYEVSEAVVQASATRDQLKDTLGLEEANVAIAVRDQAQKVGEKITEAMVREYVTTAKAVTDAQTAFLEAKGKADEVQQLREAFIQRSFMLRDLVSLYASGYFMKSAVEGSQRGPLGQQLYNESREKLAQVKTNRRKLQATE